MNSSIKKEPADEECFGNCYPEVALNESEVQMPARVSKKYDHSEQDFDNFESPFLSKEDLCFLMRQLEGVASPLEVLRSVNCFIPIIRLENHNATLLVSNNTTTRTVPGQRKGAKNGQKPKRKNCRSRIVKNTLRGNRKQGRPLSSPEIDTNELEILPKVPTLVIKQTRHHSCAKFPKKYDKSQNGGEVPCTECDMTFKNPNCHKYHCRSIHTQEVPEIGINREMSRPTSRVCEICNKTFTRVSGLLSHRRGIHGRGKAFEKRKKRFREEGVELNCGLESTTIEKHVPKRYQCSYCSKSFIHASLKYCHELSHTGEKPFLCVICGKGYKSCGALREHEKTTHTNTLDLLCTICGAAFGRQMGLKYHILAKHGEKKFKCGDEGCTRAFVLKATLKRHARSVHSKGLQQCHLCHRTFPSNLLLDQHLSFHERRKLKGGAGRPKIVKKRPDPATPKTVRIKKEYVPKLRKPRNTPAPVRKLQCTHCTKRFPYQNELDKHIQAVHTGEREFKCPEEGCPKAYISEYKLQNHLRNGHGHVIESRMHVTCYECAKVVRGIGRLVIHKNSRHPIGGIKQVRPGPTLGKSGALRGRPSKNIESPMESATDRVHGGGDDDMKISIAKGSSTMTMSIQHQVRIISGAVECQSQPAHMTHQRYLGGFQHYHHTHVPPGPPPMQHEVFYSRPPHPTPLQPPSFPNSPAPYNLSQQAHLSVCPWILSNAT